MTLILAVKDPENHRVIMCADSGTQFGDWMVPKLHGKLARSGEWIIGTAGLSSYGVALRKIAPPSAEGDWDDALRNWQVEAEKTLADQAERIRKIGDDGGPMGYNGLVARGDRVWRLEPGGAEEFDVPFLAIGGAEDYARGAMQLVSDSGAAIWRNDLVYATELVCLAVAKQTRMVLGPWNWMATDGMEGRWE